MLLSIENLTKSYGNHIALRDINLTLTAGVYALLGPNGAGKSTLMNLITGNLQQDSGQICYNGASIEKLGRQFRSVLGFMPQQQGIYENFTAYQFLSYMSALKGMTRRKAQDEIPWALETVNLKEAAHHKLGTFSGGMKQRILVAQAIMNNPEVLILDEPTAGLDPNPDKPEKFIITSAPFYVILKKKGVFICYLQISIPIKSTVSLPAMTA